MEFQINKEFINHASLLIANNDIQQLTEIFSNVHYADLAELFEEIEPDLAVAIIKILDTDKTSDAIVELDEDYREEILKRMSSAEIAKEVDELESDDAADVLSELSEEQKEEVISKIEDVEHAKDIVDLLRYDEDTAGGLMGKELVKVKNFWTNLRSIKEMRLQAEDIERVYTIYVVDDNDVLKGRLSLKSLLTTSTKSLVNDVYTPSITSVKVDDKAEDVAKIMQKYDLVVVAVVDEMNRLVGQITIDDIVDIIKDEAERDYQIAAGITDDVEASDSVLELTKARLPWLILGLLGGFCSGGIMGNFGAIFNDYPMLFFYTPLIAALAGNVGVQSSAIIVQGLANNNIKGSMWDRMLKEIGLSLVNGLALGTLIIGYGFIRQYDFLISLTIASSLVIVIIIAALIGTFVPIVLDKKGIDPALATGPFITTSNDIFGIFIYFSIARLILPI
ncbi:magnesium transporter [Wenyingzhuangia sp. 2_MG-2023]|uniref:magnesium transporter n=1 Tax=Wenyingzhuangia sp. 2_MG-2023 TaxID=3062639 RepID=UPI0026E34338|nr:magnesium transporter [Wenyingzhuangia sp. 2_MG-2023]MDO6736240.1 magnesium transporter [Wenyingzhuangia sp. 2_MG-2023]MDO6801456.1 magnesium transporter [Wenyingzhuangia sp. 1_MG-2023]